MPESRSRCQHGVLRRHQGVTHLGTEEEHRTEHADAQTYSYSQYCENYRRFAKRPKRSMRQALHAGEKLFIDFAGPTVSLTDGGRAHIFIGGLGASGYTFACATARETMADWLGATAAALAFIGGVPQLIVPDNPRALIADANRYEPRANDTVLDFARHDGTSFLPARARHPQDKAKVESAVQVVERWILARLRGQRFATVHEVNRAIAPLLERLNQRPFQKLPGQPRQRLCGTRCVGASGAAGPTLRAGHLQDGEGAYRLPRRTRTPLLQRAARPGGASPAFPDARSSCTGNCLFHPFERKMLPEALPIGRFKHFRKKVKGVIEHCSAG
jgi:transposase